MAAARPHRSPRRRQAQRETAAAGKCAALLKALAEPERLRIVQALRERPQSVSDLAALLDNEVGNISHHLKILRRQGIVAPRREGKSIIYSLAAHVFAERSSTTDRLDLGCCRLEFPKPEGTP